jgi:hypothetical protein
LRLPIVTSVQPLRLSIQARIVQTVVNAPPEAHPVARAKVAIGASGRMTMTQPRLPGGGRSPIIALQVA